MSLCLSIYLWAFLHLSPIALFMTFRLPYFSAVKDIFVWRVASQRLFPLKFHWVFFSSVVVSRLLLSLLCCVVLCGSHLYKQTDYHFKLLLSAEHALLSRCVWLTQRATSDTRQWVKMPMHFHLHCQSSSLSSSHCLSLLVFLSPNSLSVSCSYFPLLELLTVCLLSDKIKERSIRRLHRLSSSKV